MFLTKRDSSHTSNIVPTGNHAQGAHIELEDVLHLASRDIDTNAVIDLDKRVMVADGACIVCGNVRDALLPDGLTGDLAQLVGAFLLGDEMRDEAALGVVQEAEGLFGALDCNHVHEASGVRVIGAHFPVDLDEALLHDHVGLDASERVLESVAQN